MDNEIYARFEELLKIKGVTAYKVCNETGIKSATLTSWKQGKYTPKQNKLQLIADYFGVSLDYLMTGKEHDARDKFSAEMAHMVAKIRNDDKLSGALQKYFELSPDKQQFVLQLIEFL